MSRGRLIVIVCYWGAPDAGPLTPHLASPWRRTPPQPRRMRGKLLPSPQALPRIAGFARTFLPSLFILCRSWRWGGLRSKGQMQRSWTLTSEASGTLPEYLVGTYVARCPFL